MNKMNKRIATVKLERVAIYASSRATAGKETTKKVVIVDEQVVIIGNGRNQKFFSYNGKTIENEKTKYVIISETN